MHATQLRALSRPSSFNSKICFGDRENRRLRLKNHLIFFFLRNQGPFAINLSFSKLLRAVHALVCATCANACCVYVCIEDAFSNCSVWKIAIVLSLPEPISAIQKSLFNLCSNMCSFLLDEVVISILNFHLLEVNRITCIWFSLCHFMYVCAKRSNGWFTNILYSSLLSFSQSVDF